MLFLALLILFIVVPILEIYVIVQVGEAIGVWWTIALLLADSVLGTMLMKAQGRSAWRRFQLALAEGRMPGREVLDGVLVIFGGALLLAPGFVTDVCGALLLLPPTRAVVRRILGRRVTMTVLGGRAAPRFGAPRPPRGGGGDRDRASGRTRRREGDYDVEGTATEIDPRRLP